MTLHGMMPSAKWMFLPSRLDIKRTTEMVPEWKLLYRVVD